MNRDCPLCEGPGFRTGHFVRKSDGRAVQKFKCKRCKNYSNATLSLFYRHKKRRIHMRILEHMASGVSERRTAKLLKVSRVTVVRKINFLYQFVKKRNFLDLHKMQLICEFQFDDLETIEHTKLKPLSVTMAVEKYSRRILGFEVSRMPAKGLLAKRAFKKYGYRRDERALGRNRLFERIKPKIDPRAIIESDRSPHYPFSVKKWFPLPPIELLKGRGDV